MGNEEHNEIAKATSFALTPAGVEVVEHLKGLSEWGKMDAERYSKAPPVETFTLSAGQTSTEVAQAIIGFYGDINAAWIMEALRGQLTKGAPIPRT
jgi:hypothetical protein